MPEYREIAPSPHLAAAIECFWIGQAAGGPHRVTPDGCADILFTNGRLEFVGPMTVWRDFPLEPGQRTFGVRFRPGRWRAIARGSLDPADRLKDLVVPLSDLWGSRTVRLAEQLGEAASVDRQILAFETALPIPADSNPVERALAWMERRRGAVSMDELAGRAGLSARQLRRVCLESTGLTPKFLARVLRFRYALQRLARDHRRPSLAELALDCGYYDQAHFIHDFRQFSGRTPAAAPITTGDGRFFQSPTDDAAVISAA